MPGRLHRCDAGRDLLTPIEWLHSIQDVPAENPAVVLEQAFHTSLRRAAHLTIVHPELMFDRWYKDFGIREGWFAVDPKEAIHVVLMIMRDDDCIDRLNVDAGCYEILLV